MNLFKNDRQKPSSLLPNKMAKKLSSVLYISAYLYLAICTVQVANEDYLPDTKS